MDKYVAFTNYMHNELGITKEDIRSWIKESVKEQAKLMLDKTFDSFDVTSEVAKVVRDEKYFGSKNLQREIRDILAEEIMKRVKFV